MVNFHDPTVETLDSFALSKFWHLMSGIYIWEFFTNLDFEWSIIQGRRRYRWTIWVYSLARIGALVAVTTDLVLLNLTPPFNCQLVTTLTWIPGYVALASASFLVVLRIVAIWNRKMAAVVIAAVVWTINSAFFIQGMARFHIASEISDGPCVVLNIQVTQMTIVAAFTTDMLLLIIMLAGLFRLGCHRDGALATGRFLWNQGIIWILLATVAGVLPTVFVCLNLNAPLGIIFLIPWLTVMSIAATRMYRGLDDFFFSEVRYTPSTLGPSSNTSNTISISRAWGTPTAPIPLDGIRVDVHRDTGHNHSVTTQARDSLSDKDRQLHEKQQVKPHELV